MRALFVSLSLILSLAVQGAATQATAPQAGLPVEASNIVGRWRVKFTPVGGSEKNLVFEARAKGSGSFQLLDTGPDDKPVPDPRPASWSLTTNNNLSISGEVELPLGTCCRELGTLIFKGKFTSENSISGKLLFITSVAEEENPFQYRSLLGTFTATRVLK